jgi:hypothetical protein
MNLERSTLAQLIHTFFDLLFKKSVLMKYKDEIVFMFLRVFCVLLYLLIYIYIYIILEYKIKDIKKI